MAVHSAVRTWTRWSAAIGGTISGGGGGMKS